MTKNRRGSVKKPGLDVLGPLQDIIRQMREGKITNDQLQAFVEHRNPFIFKSAVDRFQLNKTKDGWTLLEDVPFDGIQFTPDIVGFFKPGESSVHCDVMRVRAREANANLGQRHAEYLLVHQELIPTNWRGKHRLVFPGTLWGYSGNGRYVQCLDWFDGQWRMDLDSLENVCVGCGRLVSLSK